MQHGGLDSGCAVSSAHADGAADAEAQRLETLASFAILDTPAEKDFDDLALLAAQLCGTPMAMVTLIDATRQWLKARVGFEGGETAREDAFCSYALGSPELLVIPDARVDPRFRANPYVIGEPFIRFYAGAPLVTSEGHILGTLCVTDTIPRQLSRTQCAQLAMLAAQVVNQLEFRRQAARLRSTARLLDGVLSNADVLIYAKDVDGRFVMANPATVEVTPVAGGLIGRRNDELFPTGGAQFEWNDRRVLSTGRREVFSEEFTHSDGTVHTYRSTKYPLFDDDGEIVGIAGISTDVTELVLTRAAHAEAEQRWRTLVEDAPVAVQVVDADGRISYVNRSAIALYGAVGAAQIEMRAALDFTPDGSRDALCAMIGAALAGESVPTQVHTVRKLDGTLITVEYSATRISSGQQRSVQIELRDVTAAARARKELEHHASTDPLTGILNRRAWNDQLDQLLASQADSADTTLVIALIDFDHFKSYNDTHGHNAGDALLRDFAHTARSSLRTGDVFARWGGEEFIVALPGIRGAHAARILERIRRRIPFEQTCSIGYTVCMPGESLPEAIGRADEALYAAKAQGRNRIVQY